MNQREQNNRDNYGPRNQGKPSRQRKQETAFRALRKEARENKRYQG